MIGTRVMLQHLLKLLLAKRIGGGETREVYEIGFDSAHSWKFIEIPCEAGKGN